MADERFDMMIYGASGFTGQYTVEILAKTAKEEGVTWAVSGRSEERIKKVLNFVASETGINLDHIKIFKADSSNYESLTAMSKVSKIVLNCVGPYRWFGEPVVRACLETDTDHIDISGEPNFLEKIQLLYNDLAKKKKVYIIGACGFDSIPCEMGTVFLNKKFGDESELNSIEQFIRMTSEKNMGGGKVNHGTWDSAVNSYSVRDDLAMTRQKLDEKYYTKKSPSPKYPLKSRGILSKNENDSFWNLLFPSPDISMFTRTQKELFLNYNRRQCQLKSYLQVESRIIAFFIGLVGIILGIMAPFKFTRNLLHKYPEFFSFGIFGKSGPKREKVLSTGFEMRFVGEGWKEKLAEPTDQHDNAPDKKLTIMVKGPNAGYISTPIAMIQSALVILREKDKLPKEGGVYTPGVAFQDTTLIEKLQKNGMKFEVIN